MLSWRFYWLGFLGSLILAVPVSSTLAAPAPVPFMPGVDTWVVTSAGSHRAYQIWVARPDGYAKRHAPYPVLYVGDANAVFGIAVETAYLLSLAKQIPPVVVVGIGYPKPGHGYSASWLGRFLDFTPPIDKAQADRVLKDWRDKSKAYGYDTLTAVGGASEFLAFIRQELIPSIQARYNVSASDRAWAGNSFGGLFGLYALLNGDDPFQRLLISSPSIGFADHVINQFEADFASTHRNLPARVFLSTGDSGDIPVADIQSLAATLKSHEYSGLNLEVHIFEGENHTSGPPAAFSLGLRSIYSNVSASGSN
jgi:predicted alpha/beta superfamily hydrolase